MLLSLVFVLRPAPTCCFLHFSCFAVQKMSPYKLPSNSYKSGRKSKCMFWKYDKQLWARNGTALCKKFNYHFDGQKTPSISLGRNQSWHKDLCQPIPLCLNKPYILLPAYIGTYVYKREDCVKNHLAESPELHQKCRHDLEKSRLKKKNPSLLHWEKYFYVYKDICHQLSSELYLWLRAKLKPAEERIILDHTIFKEYVKTQLLDNIHVIKQMNRFIYTSVCNTLPISFIIKDYSKCC